MKQQLVNQSKVSVKEGQRIINSYTYITWCQAHNCIHNILLFSVKLTMRK